MSGIVTGAREGVDAFTYEKQQQQLTKASSILASAQLDWTEQMLEREKAYEPSTGSGFARKIESDFDSYTNKAAGDLTDPAVRRMFNDRMQTLRGTFTTRAAHFEVGARSDWRRQMLDTNLSKRAAAAEIDPSMALPLMAEQMAEISVSPELSVVDRSAGQAKAKADIATAAARTLALRDPVALQQHPVFAMIPADKLPGIMAAAEKSDQLRQAQRTADSIMTMGLPMADAMRLIERDNEGEREHAIKAEVQGRYSYVEAGRKEAQLQVYGTAQLEVEQRGRVTPATWAQLADTHRAAILNRQQAEAKQRRAEAEGRPIKTDPALYLSLREMADDKPDEFARLDLKGYVDRIGMTELKQLTDLRTRQAKAPREPVSLTQQLNATMQSVGIKKPEQKGKFLSFTQAEVDAATDAKGKPLDFSERQQIIDRALLKGPDPDAWLFGTKRNFELTPDQRTRFKPDATTDAPVTEHEQLNAALQAQGLSATAANRLALYQRVVGAKK